MMSEYGFLDHPVFITGHATSGTTLLRNILDGHPELLVMPVETNLRAIIRRDGLFVNDFNIEKFLTSGPETGIYSLHHKRASLAGGDRDYNDFDFEAFSHSIKENWDGESAKSLQLSLLKSFYEKSRFKGAKPKMWIEKTHGNELYLDLFFKWYPNAKAIHLVRDPYDNFASYRKKMKKKGGVVTAVSFCNEWLESSRKIVWLKKRNPQRIMIIRFEDLLEGQEENIKKICDFLKISFHDSLKTPTSYGIPWSGNSQQNIKFNGISREPIGSHKDSLDKKEIDCLSYALSQFRPFFYWKYPKANIHTLKHLPMREFLLLIFIRLNVFKTMQGIYRTSKSLVNG